MDEKNCLNCKSFCWWDGDYCCIEKGLILCESLKGFMNEGILISLENNKNCKHWKLGDKSHIDVYMKSYNDFINKRK